MTKAIEKAIPKTMLEQISDHKDQIGKSLASNMDADKFVQCAWTAIRVNPALRDASPNSLIGALILASQFNLEISGPGGKGHAYLVPFGREITFILGYKGMLALAYRSGKVSKVTARIVYENDVFDVEYGLTEKLEHKPNLDDRGKPKHCYVVIWLSDGSQYFESMTVAEIEKIRQAARSKNSQAWRDNWDEMAKKTVIRRAFKYVQVSPEMDKAIAVDEAGDANVDQGLLDWADDKTIEAESQEQVKAKVVGRQEELADKVTGKQDPTADFFDDKKKKN